MVYLKRIDNHKVFSNILVGIIHCKYIDYSSKALYIILIKANNTISHMFFMDGESFILPVNSFMVNPPWGHHWQRWADTLQYVTAGKLDKVTFFSYPDFSFL